MKRCKVCKEPFTPKYLTTQPTCNDYKCILAWGNLQQDKKHKAAKKAFRAETRKLKEKAKTRSQWLAEAQQACNAYIRERDKADGCISCGTMKPDIQYCAGHFKTRGGHPELRFHPLNIHKQCNKHCNKEKSGNIAVYRPRLIEKIGLANVEWLEGPHEAQNWVIDDVMEIKQYYKEQLKLLQEK